MPPILTRRMRQVLRGCADGLSNAEIAERLGVAEDTVKTHLLRVYKALGMSSRGAIMHYYLWRMLRPEARDALRTKRAYLDFVAAIPNFSPSERRVLEALGTQPGASNTQIGEALFLAESTIKTHLRRIAARCGTGNRNMLMVYWLLAKEANQT